ncbi:hypothetical protein [Streptomyces klenkii]
MTVMTSTAAEIEPSAEQPRTWSCFVIGPIGDRHAKHGSDERNTYERAVEIFEKVVLPACSRHGLVPVRADGIAEAGDVTEQICRHVVQADIVIADVSGGNPNVMYELGVRHATGKPTISIGEHGRLPFDIFSVRTIHFESSRSGLIEARKELETALESALSGSFQPLAPARIMLGLGGGPQAGEDAPGEELEDENAPGLVERMTVVEEQMEEMSEDLDGTLVALQRIAESGEEFLPTLGQPGSPASAQKAVLLRYAREINGPAADLRAYAERFAVKMTSLDETVKAVIAFMQEVSTTEGAPGGDSSGFRTQLMGMSASIREGLQSIVLLEAVFKIFTSLSRDLRTPGRDIAIALKLFRQAATLITEWERQAATLS